MSRRRKNHGCGITVLVLLLLFVLAGGAVGFLYVKKYMPSNELADKSRIFGIKSGGVALLLDNELQDGRVFMRTGRFTFLWSGSMNISTTGFTGMRMRGFWCMPCRTPSYMQMRALWGRTAPCLR